MPTIPTITLQPNGPRPPSPTQKANILAILGAAAASHGHTIGEVDGLAEALSALASADSSRIVLESSDTPPTIEGADPNTLWLDTTDGSISYISGGAWVQLIGGGGIPPVGDPAPRETLDIVPIENTVVACPAATDVSIYLRPAANIARVDILFPTTPADGQIVNINTAGGVARTVGLRLYWSGNPAGSYTSETINEADARTYQYFSDTATWRSL